MLLSSRGNLHLVRGLAGPINSGRSQGGLPPGRADHATPFEDGPFPVGLPELMDFRLNWLLALFLGALGADRFHRGCLATGILKLVTLGGVGLWWAWDLLAVATGYAVDGRGHPMKGRPGQRILAMGISVAVIAGAGTAFASAVAPAAQDFVAAAGRLTDAAVNPPRPVWEPLARFAGKDEGPTRPFTVAGDALILRYTFDDAGFVYLLPAGMASVPDGSKPVISSFDQSAGTITIGVRPGDYLLYVQSRSGWMVAVVERVIR